MAVFLLYWAAQQSVALALLYKLSVVITGVTGGDKITGRLFIPPPTQISLCGFLKLVSFAAK